MDHTSRSVHVIDDSRTSRRLAKGHSLENLAIATGLTTEEIAATENGGGQTNHVERIENALR